eukprot:3168637-Rhodomonas_salina.1
MRDTQAPTAGRAARATRESTKESLDRNCARGAGRDGLRRKWGAALACDVLQVHSTVILHRRRPLVTRVRSTAARWREATSASTANATRDTLARTAGRAQRATRG